MAAGWIKLRKSLPDDLRVHRIAAACRISVDAVLGKLARLWMWADEYATADEVDGLSLSWVNAKIEQSGFAEALVTVGWVRATATGFCLVNFGEHNWQTGKDKALAANRQANARDRASRPERDGARDAEGDGARDLPTPRPSPRQRPKKEDPPGPPKGGKGSPPIAYPDGLDTEGFRAAFAAWLDYRRERKKALTPSSVGRLLGQLAGMGAARAAAAIDHSIAQGYQGVYEPAAARTAAPGPAAVSHMDAINSLFGPEGTA